MASRELIQTHSAKAQELFEKLLNTSDRATRTRQRLVDQLKAELNNLIEIEGRLFPLLERHVQDVVQQGLKENRHTRDLIAHLEHSPKNGESFLAEIATLKNNFQEHLRNEKDLLPGLLKIIGDDQIKDVVTNIKAEQQDEVPNGNRRHDSLDGLLRVAEADLGSTAPTLQDTAGQTDQMLAAAAQPASALVNGLEEVSRAWLEVTQKQVRTQVDALIALSRCRSLHEIVATQGSVVREHVFSALESNQRLTQASARAVQHMVRNITRGPREVHKSW